MASIFVLTYFTTVVKIIKPFVVADYSADNFQYGVIRKMNNSKKDLHKH